MDQKHTSGNWTVCMFFFIKLLKCRKNITERRNICQLSSYSIFVALLGQKFGTGISFSSARESGWPKAKSLTWVDHRIWFKSAMMEIERCFSSHLMDSYLSLSLSAFLDWKPFNKGNFCTNGLLHWFWKETSNRLSHVQIQFCSSLIHLYYNETFGTYLVNFKGL